MSLITAQNISLYYSNNLKPALNQVSFSIEQGRITQFLGRSGSGKTTLLKSIANLNSSFTGDLRYQGQEIKNMLPKNRASHIGFVSQSFDLFPHMNVVKNCAHPQIHVLNTPSSQAEQHAHQVLEHLGLKNYFDRYPSELSGGQKQRVSIARALCMNSKLLLMDEPTSALDPESSAKLLTTIKKLNQEGVTIALSTHDMNFAKNLLDRVYFMKDGEIIEFIDMKNNNLSQATEINKFFAA